MDKTEADLEALNCESFLVVIEESKKKQEW